MRPTKNVVPQTLSFGPGSYSFTWPEFNQIVFDLSAAGGGGGGAVTQDYQGHSFPGTDGNQGGNSYIDLSGFTLMATGGGGGGANNYSGGTQGVHGTGLNGDSNITAGGAPGGVGGSPQFFQGGYGGYGGRVIRTVLDGAIGSRLFGQVSTVVVGYGGSGGQNGGIFGSAGAGSAGWATITIS
ncbi:hypothetical protein [Bosea sp. ASV33]|uniref:hypothetical protein n=1 Tax=Bosea sp. ASV33 TaxID=2795106 RepID=UPI0018EB1277|nr:hypothetical protein [Bosea sp. ASV33]